MTYPKQIKPSSIEEAVVGIKFDSDLPSDAVFGVVYNVLKDSYKTIEKLPILQIPEAIRNNDPNMIFQPHYKMRKDRFTIQIGPKMFSISIVENYTTWESYLSEILDVLEKVKEISFISKVSRFGLRYINYFEFEKGILENLNVELKIINNQIDNEEVYIRTAVLKEEFKVLLQIGNQLILEKETQEIGRISIIDTDVFLEGDDIDYFENMKSFLDKAHQVQKETFFGLLKNEFIQSLNPEY